MSGVTEDEARQKLCPLDVDAKCAASKCMMWRWNVSPDSAADLQRRGHKKNAEATGFCGLAGKPFA